MIIFYLFDFVSLWSPFFALYMLLIILAYYFITVRYRKYFKESTPLAKKQAISFILFIVLLYIIKGSPIDLMSHMMLTMHMLQMAFLLLILPILFIKGIPNWLWRVVLNNRIIKALVRFFTKPVIALLLFNAMFSLYHIPLILDFSKTSNFYHALIHTLLFLLAILMYWPLLNSLEEYNTMSGLQKVGYIFANGMLMLPPCALIIFADTPLYATYSDPETWINALSLCATPSSMAGLGSVGPEILEMFNPLGLLYDQQLGGIIMKAVQETVYGIILAMIFRAWYRKEQEISDHEENTPLLQR
ncbi:cytochrome c oxidase assembly factor CtaG [Bacillus sp. FSL K6-3431]|uniref:cytochrome c oxidase assembly factor CtaG n=1 Tax=Bacillus sp. FSL K6-3431 TaxID=2921500 RepID=UPI0030F71B26